MDEEYWQWLVEQSELDVIAADPVCWVEYEQV